MTLRPIATGAGLAGALMILAFPAAARGQAEPRTLTVVGRAELRVAPDVAEAVLSVTTRDRTAERASAENARRSEAVLKAVRAVLGPRDRAETLSYRIQPIFEYPKGGPRQQVGFDVVNSLRVRTRRLEKLGAIFDRASAAADVSVDSLRFQLADPTKAQAEALELAGKAARQRAARAADGVGVTLRRVRSIREAGAAAPPPPRPMVAQMREAAADASANILPQELVVSAELQVTYDIE